MPELPEVETVKRGLGQLIIGRKVGRVTVHDSPKSFPNSTADVRAFLEGATVKSVRRRAKLLLIDFDSDYSLAVHLKMTGQLVFVGAERFGAGHPNDSLVGNLPDKSTRVTLKFDDRSDLFFNDQRRRAYIDENMTVMV